MVLNSTFQTVFGGEIMNVSVFDIIGPIMVGPSSSHTAGACRIGNLTREIVGKKIKKALIYLHGSFKETYKGHGTDKAIVGGLLGFRTDNYNIKNSFEIAKESDFEYEFIPIDLDDVHPNTVKLELYTDDGEKTTIIGASVGGGNITINEINNIKVDLRGQFYTLITTHKDRPGMIAKISLILQQYNINIANMHVLRDHKEGIATAIIELDQSVEEIVLELMRTIPEINSLRLVRPIL